LDVAKLLAAVIPQENQRLSDYINQSATFRNPTIPLIAVPTTAGTGSEVTPFASLETGLKKKISISDAALFPSVAVVDPLLTYSMPAYLTASSGFDAISQAIESFWSIHATPDSRSHALRSLPLSIENLPRVMKEPLSSSGRSSMALASCEAGLAIAQTKTTAVHSVSYPITAHFRIAHGHACALTLSSFIRFNAPVLKEEGRPLLNAFKVSTYEEMADRVDRLMERVGLERKLSSLGIPKKGIELILQDGFRPDRIKNNPREVTKEALQNILNLIY
jgi:alcohol dehydrogenase class IV